LTYTKEAFQTEAKAVLGEYNKNFANPFFQIEEKLRETAFDKSTYKHSAMGFLKDIQDMPNQFDYSLQFFDRFYRPENCIIVITGDFNPQEALAQIKKYYSPWKRGSHQTVNPPDPSQTAERSAKIDYPGNTLPVIAIAHKAPAYNPADREYAALSLLGPLAFGETSELYQQLVLKEQLVDLLGPDFEDHRDPFLFTVVARLKKAEDLPKVQAAILGTLENLKKTPVSAKRLTDLKSNIKYSFLLSLNTSKAVASRLAPYIALRQDIASIDTLFKSFDSVTAEDIQQVANKYFVAEKRTVVTLTGGK
jgi:zinc protease